MTDISGPSIAKNDNQILDEVIFILFECRTSTEECKDKLQIKNAHEWRSSLVLLLSAFKGPWR